ncbi:alpha/beta fold hydrolase [Nocardioides marmorisolisilvae]|uniref:alpha/beta fold hydrolase n=1 Tax=Nocardioides marmorisolisilvae TaxID=1542737 RepID=UPI00161AD90E|nr:alpha/beta fold hydrolase [Nocardioides marmorisolisilvae]
MTTGGSAEGTSELEVGGVPLRVRISGPADGVPVLLIHGIARSLEDWTEAQDLLAASGHRVISTDLPGFGFSRRGKERPGLPAFGRAMAALLEAAGVTRPAHVVGNSLGGGVAMTLAVDHPGTVVSLTLVNSIGFGSDQHVSLAPMAYAALAGLPGLEKTFRPKTSEAGIALMQANFFDPSFATPERLREAGRLAKQRDYQATFLGTAATLGAPIVGIRAGWRRALLARVRESGIPVLVIWGDADKILPPTHYEAARAELPDAQGHLFADTGHMPQIEKTAEFVDVVTEFIAKLEATR